jgi:hypothetical protein
VGVCRVLAQEWRQARRPAAGPSPVASNVCVNSRRFIHRPAWMAARQPRQAHAVPRASNRGEAQGVVNPSPRVPSLHSHRAVPAEPRQFLPTRLVSAVAIFADAALDRVMWERTCLGGVGALSPLGEGLMSRGVPGRKNPLPVISFRRGSQQTRRLATDPHGALTSRAASPSQRSSQTGLLPHGSSCQEALEPPTHC